MQKPVDINIKEKIGPMLDALNPQQRIAAETLYGPVLVLAGAGSGKTKTLTCRIANMISQGIDVSEMFVATFTNKAAKEMKGRIAEAVGEDVVRNLWMGTFHSLCVRILRKHGHYLGYESNFSIMDTGDSLKLVERIYKMRNVDEKTKPGLALYYMDNAKNNLWTPQYCAYNNASTPAEEMCAIVYADFQEMAREMNAMDFGDLIMNVVRLLEEFPTVRDYWQNRFKFVFSDEYQDANSAQFQLLRLLAFPNNNIFVVGDPQQSIYAFRGAEINLILSFEHQYFPATVITLAKNYRSVGNIVHAGNMLMTRNTHIRLELETDKMNGRPLAIVKLDNEVKEAAFVVAYIQKQVKLGNRSYKDFAILYRTNGQSAPFEKIFLENMIPYKVVGGTGFFQREEIKDIVAYLKVINNRKDDNAIMRIVNKPARGISDATMTHVVNYANSYKVSLSRALKATDDIPELKKAARTKSQDFIALLDHLESKQELDIVRYVRYVLDMTGYYKYWDEKKTTESEERIDNIKEFLRLVGRYQEDYPDKKLAEFLQEISLLMDFDNESEENSIRLMTIHGSKGLEFPVVFGVGMNEGIFPSYRSRELSEIEEERRLAYVLVTRGEEEIILTNTSKRMSTQGSGMQSQERSRFLSEIPEEIVKSIDLTKK